ncbi:stachyose synthase-like [Fagus crenata]
MAPPNRVILDEYFDFSNGNFSVNGVPLLSEVPTNVSFSPFSSICQSSEAPLPLFQRLLALSHKGGFNKDVPSDRLMNSLGSFTGRDFLSIFRFKTWWSTMWVGNSGSNLQMETQWVLLNVPEIKSYVIIIPIIEGSFRSALHPGTDGHIMICAESGSTQVKASNFDAIAYVHVSDNPYNLMKEAYSAVRKTVSNLVDKFGWCTWDAFYLTVEPAGVWHGVNDFVKGGVSPRFLIIDDGWQSINLDGENPNEDKKNLKGGSMLGPNAPSFDPKKPKMLISKAIELEHAEKDCDKAIQSGVTDFSGFEAKILKFQQELDEMFGGEESSSGFKGCSFSPGLDGTTNDLAVVKIVEGGIGLVHPDQSEDFYDSMHSYLASVGITGVKVDVIHTLEYVSEEYGGQVELAKAYFKGPTSSLSINFGSGLISSMQQCNDFFFLGTHQISMGRVGDDFWFQDPNGDPMGVYWLQGVHMIHCAYNSMWMGQIIQPDLDMFQSDHLCAKFHAGSRAICGGPVYVSDSVGGHDFDLIKKLVYPDGTIPKCQHFALPTRDCLFKNPLFDQKTLSKFGTSTRYQ